jgi:hypothetical protein
MKRVKTFESFLNEGNTGNELAAKFTQETGISTWDSVKLPSESGKWLVVAIWAPKDRGGKNPGLEIELTKGSSRMHFQVMDDDGKLTSKGEGLKKV